MYYNYSFNLQKNFVFDAFLLHGKVYLKDKITVQGTEITIISEKESDYISLTDMANAKEGGAARAADIIKNWLRTRTTLEFLGTWEQLYNLDFKVVEFDHFKMQAGFSYTYHEFCLFL